VPRGHDEAVVLLDNRPVLKDLVLEDRPILVLEDRPIHVLKYSGPGGGLLPSLGKISCGNNIRAKRYIRHLQMPLGDIRGADAFDYEAEELWMAFHAGAESLGNSRQRHVFVPGTRAAKDEQVLVLVL
jgi:hypothetical protein